MLREESQVRTHVKIADMLTAYAKHEDKYTETNSTGFLNYCIGLKLKFTSQTVPKISIFDYLQRLYELCSMTKETLVACLIYLDRFVRRAQFKVTSHEIHR